MDPARAVASLKAYGESRFTWGLVAGMGLLAAVTLGPELVAWLTQGVRASPQEETSTLGVAVRQLADGTWVDAYGNPVWQ